MSGVAKRVSPIPASEITSIFMSRPGLQAHDLLQHSRRGLPRHEWNNDNLPARLLNGPALVLVEGAQGVVPAFDVNVRFRGSQEPSGRCFGEDANPANAFQRGQHCGAVVFRGHRALRPLELADGRIAIDPDQEGVTFAPRSFQVGDVADVEQVEAAVGDDQASATGAQGRPPLRQFVPGNDLLAEIHAGILAEVFTTWQEGRQGGRRGGLMDSWINGLMEGVATSLFPTLHQSINPSIHWSR